MPKIATAPTRAKPLPEPHASLPRMAPDFGLKPRKQYLPWSHVTSQLEQARNYWIVTVGRDARPHAMPVWGFFQDSAIYFGTARDSRKWRNIEANPKLTIHLESGDDVVIVEGTAQEITDRSTIESLRQLSEKKYGMWMPPDPKKHVVVAVQPQTVFAWSESNIQKTATRWSFEAA